MRIPFAIAIALTALAATGSRASAGFVVADSTGVNIIAAPTSVVGGAVQNSSAITAFVERQNLALAADVAVNLNAIGLYNSAGDLPSPSPIIAAGTKVDSYFLHGDHAGTGLIIYDATITFSTDILGVAIKSTDLNNTDAALGSPTTTYTTISGRGLEFDYDRVELVDQRTLKVRMGVGAVVDEVRVITAESFGDTAAAPEPSSLALGVIGILGAAGWSRRKRRTRSSPVDDGHQSCHVVSSP